MMENCKAPTLRLKALNKHNIIHIMYIEIENVIGKLTHHVDKDSNVNMQQQQII